MTLDLSVYAPTVAVDGEIIAEPMRTTVTRTFYSRVVMKLAPFVIAGWWLIHSGLGLVVNILTLFVVLIVASVIFPALGSVLSLGTGIFKGLGGLVSGFNEMMDGIIGPNKAQVPVLLVHVQSAPDDEPPKTESTGLLCAVCKHRGKTSSAFCYACGSEYEVTVAPPVTGPRRTLVRIQGQIVGGEPHIGHRVSIKAFDHKGTLLFISGVDRTTGAEIVVKRNADTGQQR